MNVFKKIVAGAALFSVVVVSTATGVSAYTNAQLDAATGLAWMGVINDHSNDPMAYNMDQTVLRQEIAAVARGVYEVDNGMAVNSAKADTCTNAFADVSATNPNTWACYTVEGLLNASVIAGNTNFRPEENITKSEALGMVVKAACGTDYAFDASLSTTWQEQLGAYATAKGIATFSDYTTAATRGFTFEAAVNAMNACDDSDDTDDLLDDLLDDLDDTDDTDDTTDPVVDGELEVTLSAETPASATVPQGISGLAVARFDFTAGDSDVTISQITVARSGLSDNATLGDLAAFTDLGRASKGKGDTQNNDTEAQLTLSNGGVIVMAGETRTITIVADVKTGTTADEFAIELVEVQASGEVNVEGSLVANLMRVGGVVAAALTVQADTTPSDVKAWEEAADVAKFKIKGDSDEDVVVKSITLKETGTVDEEDELTNFELMYDGDVVAQTTMSNGKYVTFDLGDGITIEEDQTEKFTVTADIIGGAAKTIVFEFDKNLDITAEDGQYGYGASITGEGTSFGTVNIDAGELTLVDMDAATDKIRSDKQNVELGSIKVTNVSGDNLELQKFGVNVAIAGASGTADSFAEIFENFEIEVNGTSYELETTHTATGASFNDVFKDSDLEVSLPQGVTELIIRADTKEDLTAGMTVTLSLATPLTDSTDGVFYVVETEDDTVVSDLTPSSLTFKGSEVITAGATVSRVPVASTQVVRGAGDVVAMMFEVEADEASAIEIDEVKVLVEDAATAATNTQIAQVSLYKDSVSEANLLDSVSGSNLSAGVATLEGFNVDVAADEKQNFVVTVDIVDGAGYTNPIDAYLQGVSMEDDDNDDVYFTRDVNKDGDIIDAGDTSVVTAKGLDAIANITVTDSGVLTITADAGNDDNSEAKTILGGESAVVFSADVIATNEEVDVEKVVFTVSSDLQTAVTNATLWLGDEEIATNSNSDMGTTITFDNLSNLIIPESNEELRLELNTATIGYQKVGAAISAVTVTNLVILAADAEGVESGKVLTTVNSVGSLTSQAFDIAPAVLTVSVGDTLDNGTAEVTFTVDSGDNTVDLSNTAPTVVLTAAALTDLGNGTLYQMYNEDNVGGAAATIAALSATDRTISDSETFIIVPQTTADGTTYTAKIGKNAVTYDVNTYTIPVTGVNANMEDEVDLGTKTY